MKINVGIQIKKNIIIKVHTGSFVAYGFMNTISNIPFCIVWLKDLFVVLCLYTWFGFLIVATML